MNLRWWNFQTIFKQGCRGNRNDKRLVSQNNRRRKIQKISACNKILEYLHEKKTNSGWTVKPTYKFSTNDKNRDLYIWRELRL